MSVYRFDYRLDGASVYAAKHDFVDDLDALDAAEQLAEAFEIEIYHGARLVARIKKGRRSPDVHDAHSG